MAARAVLIIKLHRVCTASDRKRSLLEAPRLIEKVQFDPPLEQWLGYKEGYHRQNKTLRPRIQLLRHCSRVNEGQGFSPHID